MTASDGQRQQLAAALVSYGIDYAQEASDALLPVVQRIADQRAAQALREAAAQEDPGPAWRLRGQADYLDPPS